MSTNEPAARIRMARKLLADGLPAVARQVLAQHLTQMPHDVAGWMLASYALRLDGDANGASGAAAHAADIFTMDPATHPEITLMLAHCLIRADLAQRARALVGALQVARVNSPKTCQQFAEVCAQLTESTQTLAWLRRACALAPGDAAARSRLDRALKHGRASKGPA